MLKKWISILAVSSALNSVWAESIENTTLDMIEKTFKQKITEVFIGSYDDISWEFQYISTDKSCKITKKQVDNILWNKITLASYSCKINHWTQKYILWQSLWKKINFWPNETCQDVSLYFLENGKHKIDIGRWAWITDTKTWEQFIYKDGNCDDIDMK